MTNLGANRRRRKCRDNEAPLAVVSVRKATRPRLGWFPMIPWNYGQCVDFAEDPRFRL